MFSFSGDKNEALQVEEKQHGGTRQREFSAKLRNPNNVKL